MRCEPALRTCGLNAALGVVRCGAARLLKLLLVGIHNYYIQVACVRILFQVRVLPKRFRALRPRLYYTILYYTILYFTILNYTTLH